MKQFVFVMTFLAAVCYGDLCASAATPVKTVHLRMIESLFAENGIKEGHVGLDAWGRVELRGNYQNGKEVDIAFSLAQAVVGVRWVSPVVPENIKVKEWAKKLSELFPTAEGHTEQDESPPGPIASKYALIVGVSQFQERKIVPLKYAAKDAKDFYAYLTGPQGGSSKREHVILLLDEKATRKNIKAALDHIRLTAQRDDLVVLYFSTHGTPPDKFGGVHMVTYDSQVKPRHAIWETSVTEDILKEFIQGLKAKRVVVIMDACYSNGAYKHVTGFLPPGGKSLGVDDEEGYGQSRAYLAKRLLGAKDLVLEEETATGTGQTSKDGWGRVLISGSDANEKSWESDILRNSFFTFYFIEGLKKYGNVKEAFEYAKPLVNIGARKEKDAEQTPQAVADRREWNITMGRH